MKLKICALLTILLFAIESNQSFAQITANTIILQPTIGGPNMKQWTYETDAGSNEYSKGFGHLGLSGEIAVSKRFGVGFDAIYSPFTRTEEYTQTIYDETTGTSYEETTVNKFEEDKLRLLAKVYIHFNVDNPIWDIYISGGMGANIIFGKAFVNDEEVNYQEHLSNSDNGFILANPFPFAGRVNFGMRYFFSDRFGICFETGFGGPPFAAGLSVKL